MSLKVMLAKVTAVVVVLGGVSSVRGDYGCGDPCGQPRLRYKTCYQTVVEDCIKTRYQVVHKTIEKECRYTVCKPVWETVEKECKKIVCKPVWEEKQVKVCTGEWKVEEYYCPGPVKAVRHRTPDSCCVDPCTGKTIRIPGQCYVEYVQCPGTVKCRKVWVPREEVRTVKVCKMVQEEVVEKVQVKVCKMVKEEVVKKVPVTVCEKVPVQVVEKVTRKVPVRVAVCECEQPRCFSLDLNLGYHLHNLRDRLCSLGGRLFGHGDCHSAPCDCHGAPAAAAPAAEKLDAPKEAEPAK